MAKKLLIAEKPSVARSIAEAVGAKKTNRIYENEEYVVTNCIGHLLRLKDMKEYNKEYSKWRMSNYPFYPNFEYVPVEETKEQLDIVVKQIDRDDVSVIYICTDADREGQLIAESVLDYSKTKKPIKRVLVEEWTPEEVNRGIKDAVDNTTMVHLRDAAYARQELDWLLGINLTSVTTLKYAQGVNSLINVGRVLSPTIRLVEERDERIRNFTPETYYTVHGEFEAKGGTYEGVLKEKDSNQDRRYQTRKEAHEEIERLKSLVDKPVIESVTKKRVVKRPPRLYSQTTLQQAITSIKGWSSEKVLEVAQELYEKQLITYPRTESNYLTTSIVDKTRKALDIAKQSYPKLRDEIVFTESKLIFNDDKVAAHSAIIPTSKKANLKELSEDERTVYEAIQRNFCAAFMPASEYEETEILTKTGEYRFLSKGNLLVKEGFLKILTKNHKDTFLPTVKQGERVRGSYDCKESKTTPPKAMTESSLLKAMLNAGKNIKTEEAQIEGILKGFMLGTSATRASIIAKALSSEYLVKTKQELHATEKGREFCRIFPVRKLLDPNFTGRIEMKLKNIEEGSLDKDEFMSSVKALVDESVALIKEDKNHMNGLVKPVGKCPVCKSDVIEQKFSYVCTCGFTINKEDKFITGKGKKVTRSFVETLLKKGKAPLRGCTGKNGKKYDCELEFEVRRVGSKSYPNWNAKYSWDKEGEK